MFLTVFKKKPFFLNYTGRRETFKNKFNIHYIYFL